MTIRQIGHGECNDFDERRDQIVSLRCAGRGVDYIAAAVGLSRKVVERVLKTEFERRLGSRQQVIESTALELEYYKSELVRKYQEKGDRRDLELALKVVDRKCKLLGLDMPVKVEVTVEDMSEADLKRQLEMYSIPTTLQLPEVIEDAVV